MLSSGFLFFKKTEKVSSVFGFCGCCGGLAWFVVFNILLYNEQSIACRDSSIPTTNSTWTSLFALNITIWCLYTLAIVGCCLYGFCVAKKVNGEASEIISASQYE